MTFLRIEKYFDKPKEKRSVMVEFVAGFGLSLGAGFSCSKRVPFKMEIGLGLIQIVFAVTHLRY